MKSSSTGSEGGAQAPAAPVAAPELGGRQAAGAPCPAKASLGTALAGAPAVRHGDGMEELPGGGTSR